jgi:hypothetical protein
MTCLGLLLAASVECNQDYEQILANDGLLGRMASYSSRHTPDPCSIADIAHKSRRCYH